MKIKYRKNGNCLYEMGQKRDLEKVLTCLGSFIKMLLFRRKPKFTHYRRSNINFGKKWRTLRRDTWGFTAREPIRQAFFCYYTSSRVEDNFYISFHIKFFYKKIFKAEIKRREEAMAQMLTDFRNKVCGSLIFINILFLVFTVVLKVSLTYNNNNQCD